MSPTLAEMRESIEDSAEEAADRLERAVASGDVWATVKAIGLPLLVVAAVVLVVGAVRRYVPKALTRAKWAVLVGIGAGVGFYLFIPALFGSVLNLLRTFVLAFGIVTVLAVLFDGKETAREWAAYGVVPAALVVASYSWAQAYFLGHRIQVLVAAFIIGPGYYLIAVPYILNQWE